MFEAIAEGVKICQGDCLEVMREIPDGSVDMVLCDLPYGTTACKWDTIIPFEPLWEQYYRVLKQDAAIVLFGSEPFSTKLRSSNLSNFKYDWIWEKPNGANYANVKHQPFKVHEIVSVFAKGRSPYYPEMEKGKPYIKTRKESDVAVIYGDGMRRDLYMQNEGVRYPRSVQRVQKTNHNSLHPTQKPVDLLRYLIRTYTHEGETVLDNCMGSGSTGVACVLEYRNFIGIELQDDYYDIAKQRIERECAQGRLAL